MVRIEEEGIEGYDCIAANDEDFENLTGAIKGAKMLQIAESLKQHFGKVPFSFTIYRDHLRTK